MKKIIFYCGWGDSPEQLLKRYSVQTPDGDGRWQDILGVSDPNEADIFVLFDGSGIHDLEHIEDSRKILFQREPTYACGIERLTGQSANKHFLYKNDDCYLLANWWIDLSFNVLDSLEYPEKSKSLSAILTNKNFLDGHKKRLNFIKNYDSKYPKTVDIYGRGLIDLELSNYLGEIRDRGKCKLPGLIEYNYSISLENGQQKNYMSEKIYDCFLAWTIPIYWGCPNINMFFPEDSLYNVDIDKEEAIDMVFDISRRMPSKKNIEALRESRNAILYKYNIWPSIKRVIDTGKLF